MATCDDRRTRPRRSREELRALLLDTALTILREQGLGLGAGNVTFKRVFERVERETGVRLTNASVIGRIWKNQADYQADVLSLVAADTDDPERHAFTAEATSVEIGMLRAGAPLGSEAAMREFCRVGAQANMSLLRNSRAWSVWLGVWALGTIGHMTDEKRRIKEALLDGYKRLTDGDEEEMARIGNGLGLRLRRGLTLRQFTVAASALAEGCALRNRVDSEMSGILLPTGPGGALREWTVFGIGVDALVHEFFEADTPVPAVVTVR